MEEVEGRIMGEASFPQYCYLNTDECPEGSGGLKTSPTCCVTPLLATNATDAHGCYRPRSATFFFRKYGDPGFLDPAGTMAKM